jgi:CheY-like chemotaxis protein
LAAEQDFDVIVMDVRMPEIDGLEATRHIRAMPPPRGLVPIVAMTAQAFAEQVVECQLAGMNGHVTKPFAPEVLCAAVREAAFADPPVEIGGIVDPAAAAAADLPDTAEQEKAAALPAGIDSAVRAVAVVPDACATASGFDSAVFARTAGLLAPEILVSSLQTIGLRGSAFLKLARTGGRFESNVLPLAEMAHTLGGCAGMFGFARLANAAKRFEYAVQSNAPETCTRAADLITAVEEAAAEIEMHLAQLNTETTQKARADLLPETLPKETAKQRRAAAASG